MRKNFLLYGLIALLFIIHGGALPVAAANTGRIVFTSWGEEHLRDGIWVMDADGTHAVRVLADSDTGPDDPIWSPDGSRIAFTALHDGLPDLDVWVMNADGTNQIGLATNGGGDMSSYDGQPAWSPDGSRIAFVTDRDYWEDPEDPVNEYGMGHIYVMNPDGSNQVRLSATDRSYSPAWSPDGSQIAFTHGGGIWVMNADGTDQVDLNVSLGWASMLAWSPDGSRIAFVHSGQIYLVSPDGSETTVLTSTGTNLYPTWSPDGSRIAFASDRDGNNEIYVMNADGTEQTRLTTNTVDDRSPSWGPGVMVAVPGATALPTDTDRDTLCDDTNGNGRADFNDVVLYFNEMNWIAVNEPLGAFDYNRNGRIDFADVVWLFSRL